MEFVGFWEILNKGGLVMYPLLGISLAAIAFAIERIIAFNQFGSLSPGLLDEVIGLIRNGRWRDAQLRTEEMPGPVAAVLGTVLDTRDLPIEDMEREANVTAEDYFIRLERFLPALDTFTTLSPLLGLLGTILGMIKVFQQFTTASTDEGRAKILEGVGESLYATAFGIAIAVVSFAVYNYFSSRQRNIAIQTDQAMNRLIGEINTIRQEAVRRGEMQPMTGRKRRVTEKHRELKKTKVEIIPMIDTMFFLLVFFILSSLGVINIQGTRVNLPKAVSADELKPAQITISIKRDGSVRVNSLDVKPGENIGPAMEKEVKRQAGKNILDIASSEVVINADSGVESQEVTRRIEEARVAGVVKFTIATDPNTAQGQ
jgi:biopolymer transport protein ExbB